MRNFIYILSISLIVVMHFPYMATAAKIVIDAGHGGQDPGAIGINGLQEKKVNLAISRIVRDELLRAGYEVIMTRDLDIFLGLQDRVNIANWANADLFVSIHANSYPTSDVRGSLVLYYDRAYPQASYPASAEMAALTQHSKQLAQSVLQSMVTETGMINRGIVPSSVYVVRMGTIPSILVETAFLSNREDAALLLNTQFQTKMAYSIAKGIIDYLPLTFRDIVGHWAGESIVRLQKAGLVSGIGNNRYAPDRPLTRAEYLTMLKNVFNQTDETDMVPSAETEAEVEDTLGEDNEIDRSVDSGVDDHAFDDRGDGHVSDGDSVRVVDSDIDITIDRVIDDITDGNRGDETGIAKHFFTDLNPDHWAYETLEFSIEHGYIEGYPDGTLRPDQAITRDEAAVLFDKFAVLDETQPTVNRADKFIDVPDNAWSASAIYRMRSAGIISGIATDRFAPHRAMSRAEIASVVDRYINKDVALTSHVF